MKKLGGMYAPIPTPFFKDESIAFNELEKNLEKWLKLPLDGFVFPASNSEVAFLKDEEKTDIWRACFVQAKSKDKVCIAGTGCETTADTIALTQKAAELGADAALVIPPNFYTPLMTHKVLIDHYITIAEESPIPLLLYNMPIYTGIDFLSATLMELAHHPQIIGIKDNSSNTIKMESILAIVPDFLVFAGTGSALLPFLSFGAVGGIIALANIAANPLSRLILAHQNDNSAEARKLQLSLVALNTAITVRYGVPALKYALDEMGFYGGPPRRPLQPLSEEGRAELDLLLKELEGFPAEKR
ncbi:MAG: dihydrodipicolinate synthase family protein [Anaerolineaceae bacterium]|nr:dihydrodipicolinate synthase family protein [Anaerolineaceae bacterium]